MIYLSNFQNIYKIIDISLNQGPGKSFGEVALVKRESFRNASIIADEDLDLLVIGQDLFDRSLKVS